MFNQTHRAFILTAISAFAVPALADDCAPAAKRAVVNSGRTPVSITTTKTDSRGKMSATRTIQTVTNKYVQTASGKWYSMNIAMKDLIDDSKTTQVTCRHSGADTVDGEPVATYEIHMDSGDIASDSKIWVTSRDLITKSEGSIGGARYRAVYDYAHVTPPAGATPMGGR
jgi:hypothetical protein